MNGIYFIGIVRMNPDFTISLWFDDIAIQESATYKGAFKTTYGLRGSFFI
jgi:hypothetical protein